MRYFAALDHESLATFLKHHWGMVFFAFWFLSCVAFSASATVKR